MLLGACPGVAAAADQIVQARATHPHTQLHLLEQVCKAHVGLRLIEVVCPFALLCLAPQGLLCSPEPPLCQLLQLQGPGDSSSAAAAQQVGLHTTQVGLHTTPSKLARTIPRAAVLAGKLSPTAQHSTAVGGVSALSHHAPRPPCMHPRSPGACSRSGRGQSGGQSAPPSECGQYSGPAPACTHARA